MNVKNSDFTKTFSYCLVSIEWFSFFQPIYLSKILIGIYKLITIKIELCVPFSSIFSAYRKMTPFYTFRPFEYEHTTLIAVTTVLSVNQCWLRIFFFSFVYFVLFCFCFKWLSFYKCIQASFTNRTQENKIKFKKWKWTAKSLKDFRLLVSNPKYIYYATFVARFV